MRTYTLTYLALMALLALTYAAAHVDLGSLNVPLGLAIATAKAMLVVLYFMHLRRTPGLNRIASAAGVFWLGILLVLSLSDYVSRSWLLFPSPWP